MYVHFLFQSKKITTTINLELRSHIRLHCSKLMPLNSLHWLVLIAFSTSLEYADDSTLRRGKVDRLLIPAGELFSAFIDEIENPHSSWITHKKSFFRTKEVSPCTWKGVICNAHYQIERIQWNYYDLKYRLSGRLNWYAIPCTLVFIDCGLNMITGGVPAERFPETLEFFSLHGNHLMGSLDLTSLPSGMKDLYGYDNAFSGTLDFSHLPLTMEVICLQHNRFEGEVRLTDLPSRLNRLQLQHNILSGIVDLTHLRAYKGVGKRDINLARNCFTGYRGSLPHNKLPSSVSYDPQKENLIV